MKINDIVSIPGYSRKGVVLRVSKADIANGLNVTQPGLYVFSGYWHGKDPLNHSSYGKIHGKVGKPIGHVRTHHQILKLCK